MKTINSDFVIYLSAFYSSLDYFYSFRIEVFDKDKLGKDKSLGKVEVNPRDLDNEEPKWFPLKVSYYNYMKHYLEFNKIFDLVLKTFTKYILIRV